MKPTDFDSPKKIRSYLNKAFAEGNQSNLTAAMGIVARQTNVSVLAQRTQLRREALYKSLSPDGNPVLSTLVKITDAWGLRLRFELKPLEAAELSSSGESDIVDSINALNKKASLL